MQAFYWGKSEWPAHQIEEAHRTSSHLRAPAQTDLTGLSDVATKFGLIAPVAEQCMHHMLARERAESEYG